MWTKEFIASGVVGKDVVELLHAELQKRDYGWVKVVALCNDTVGTLCAATTAHSSAKIGVILGTGTNACYSENVSAITKLPSAISFEGGKKKKRKMVVNMEWGGYDGFPTTAEDDAVNHLTRRAGQQRFEKMVSGRYLPMLARECMRKCIRCGWVLGCYDEEDMAEWDAKNQMTLIEMAMVHHDRTETMNVARGVIVKYVEKEGGKKLDPDHIPLKEVLLIRSLFDSIVDRSAKYAALAIGAVVEQIVSGQGQMEEIVVAVDGSVFHKYEGYRATIEKTLSSLLTSKTLQLGPTPPKIRCEGTEDGSGIGAAIIAAVQVGDK